MEGKIMVLLNREQIKQIIPHREPFLLIDEVIALEPGKKCIAKTYIFNLFNLYY
jgi:3-hydroxyacyl-[acyl-carrier-protein] dehydratase